MARRGLRRAYRGGDLTACVFGRLTAFESLPDGFWRVRCLCGATEVIHGLALESGDRTGCERCGPLVGSWYGTPVWKRWNRFRQRGQLVRAWAVSFRRFLECVGSPPPNAALVRPDQSRPLGPKNWRWVSRGEVFAKPRLYRLDGREVTTVELAKICGVTPAHVSGYARQHPEARGNGDAVRLYFQQQQALAEARLRVQQIIHQATDRRSP